MNGEHDELREMWLEESGGILPIPGPPAADKTPGESQVERFRRQVRRDARLKLSVLIFLGAAFTIFRGRMNAAIWVAVGFTLFSCVLSIVQFAWSAVWSMPSAPLPLAQALATDVKTWRRRRPALAMLLGATPALIFQIYILGYLAAHPASTSRLANLILLIAGGPILWALSSWLVWARLEAWTLKLQRALGAFDEEAAKRLEQASKRSAARTVIIVGFVLVLLIAGAALFYLAQRT